VHFPDVRPCVWLLFLRAAHASTWYVKTSGNDAHDGLSYAQAFRTIQVRAVGEWLWWAAVLSQFLVCARLQKGVQASESGDTVAIDVGTYSGAGNINIDTLGKAIHIRGGNGTTPAAGVGNTTISCGTTHTTSADFLCRGFIIHRGEGLGTVLSDLIVVGGGAMFNSTSTVGAYGVAGERGMGGGMLIVDSSPSLVRVGLHTSIAAVGGGCMAVIGNSSPALSSVEFKNCKSSASGGAVLAQAPSSVDISACTFAGGVAERWGGAVAVQANVSAFTQAGTVSITGSVFSGCSAGRGGAVSSTVGTVLVTNSTFRGNAASGVGGGLHAGGGNVTVTGCYFVDNAAATHGRCHAV